MSEISHLSQFIKFWFAHASLKSEEIQTPHSFQISCLASAYRKQVLKVPFESKEMAFLPEFFAANESEVLKSIVAENGRGIDMFFFANAVRPGFAGKSPTNEDIERRLFFPIDFDYRLPVSLEDIESELGLQFAAVTISSQREHKHHQAFLALDWASVPETERVVTTELARRICRMFGSDNVADMRRVMRLPGLINWKTAELETKGGCKSDTALVRCDVGREYEWHEVLAAVEKFERSEMSEELRALRVTPVREGGTAQGERGEFGRWDRVLEAARAGVVTLKKGSRHNALASWGCQMASARVAWSACEENLRELARGAFDVAYDTDEPEDFSRLLSDLKKKWDTIDAELDLAETEFAVEIEAAMQQELPEWQWVDDYPGERTPEGFTIASTTAEVEDVKHEQTTLLDFGPVSRGPSSILKFAEQITHRLAGEKEEHWIRWLGEILIGANFFNAIDNGAIDRLCDAIHSRLNFVGAIRQGKLYGPLTTDDTGETWSMGLLEKENCLNVVRHVLMKASRLVSSAGVKEKVRALPEVQRAFRHPKSKTAFGAKRELLAQVEREMMLRFTGRVRGAKERKLIRGMAFQNGVFDAEKWERILEEQIDPWESIESRAARVFECWIRNPEQKDDVFNPNVSWACFPNCCAAAIGVPQRLVNGEFGKFWRLPVTAQKDPTGRVDTDEENGLSHIGTARNIVCCEELQTPMFDSFLDDCFADDEEAKRGVLLVIAYCLLPDNPLQRYFFFEGVGGSGKGTLASLISLIVGENNTGLVEIERMKSDAWLGPLEGKQLAIIDEAEGQDPRTMRHAMHELARVTGSERVSARVLNQNATEIRGGWKFILIANQQPESTDKSGQQARRVVPVYFGRKKQGGIVPLLHRRIYEKERNQIAEKAMLEYYLCGVPLGEKLFEIDSPAFQEGRRRFEESTGGVRNVLKVCAVAEANCAKMLVSAVVEIWIERKESREYLKRGLDKVITSEMAVLGFRESEQTTVPGTLPGGERIQCKAFVACGVRVGVLLDELEMTEQEFVNELRRKSAKRSKLWAICRASLGLDARLFDAAEGSHSGQESFFD